MVNKITRVIVLTTLIAATTILIYSLYMTFFRGSEFNPIDVFGCSGFILIYFLCTIFLKNGYLHLNSTLVDFFILFTFSSLVLGEAGQFYHIFFFWDDLLHSLSGILVSLIMFNIFYNLSGEK